MTKSFASLALAAGCAITLTVPVVEAQTVSTRLLMNAPRYTPGERYESPAANVAASAQYERLLQTNPAFRQSRMARECGPITDPQLRASCLSSFGSE
jgi:hypothetical protein